MQHKREDTHGFPPACRRQQEGMEETPAQPRMARDSGKLPKSNPECSRHTQSHGDLGILQEKAPSH